MYPLFMLFAVATGSPLLQNITIPLTNGTSNHGTPGLVCTPTKWSDILVFYLANYAAHAATTRSLPGENTLSTALIVLVALLFPAAGAYRGFMAIMSLAIFEETDLQKAAKADALCMVVRTSKWTPRDGDVLHNTILELSSPGATTEAGLSPTTKQSALALNASTSESASKCATLAMYAPPWLGRVKQFAIPPTFHIHGYHKLPPGYALCRVPRGARFIEPDRASEPPSSVKLSYHYSFVKIAVSLGQAIYAMVTLYHTRGDQITQYGYAAFGLTVAPYAFVSLVNLLGSLLCPEFSAIYMVESSIMAEARRRGEEFIFGGTIGKIDEDVVVNSPTLLDWPGQVSSIVDSFIIRTDASGTTKTTIFNEGYKVHTAAAVADSNMAMSLPAKQGPGGRPHFNRWGVRDDLKPQCENFMLVPFGPFMKRPQHKQKGQTDSLQVSGVGPLFTPDGRWAVSWRSGNEHITLDKRYSTMTSTAYFLSFLATLVPIILIGALTGFHKGRSTAAQRAWTMAWLAFGGLGSGFARVWPMFASFMVGKSFNGFKSVWLHVAPILPPLVYTTPAMGGFVVVGQMLRSYGTCIYVS